MALSPSLQQLEIAVAKFIKENLDNLLDISISHPKETAEVTKQARCVVEVVNDMMYARSITHALREPVFTFTLYSLTYPHARNTEEQFADLIESWSPPDINQYMVGQEVIYIRRVSRSGVFFDPELQLYYCNLSFGLRMSTLEVEI